MQICVIGQNNFCLDKGRENWRKKIQKKKREKAEALSPLELFTRPNVITFGTFP